MRWLVPAVLAWLSLLGAQEARADLLPADEIAIPRLIELRGIERFKDTIVVIQNCYPQRSIEDESVLPYCVIRDSAPFIGGGKLYLAPASTLTLSARTAAKTDASDASSALRAKPIAIEEPPVNLTDPSAFFTQHAGLIHTPTDFGFRDHVAVKMNKALRSVTEVYEVTALDNTHIELKPLRVVWTCQSETRLEGPATAGPNQLPAAPSCMQVASAPEAQPLDTPPTPDAPGDARPLWTLGLLGAVILAVTYVVIRKRR